MNKFFFILMFLLVRFSVSQHMDKMEFSDYSDTIQINDISRNYVDSLFDFVNGIDFVDFADYNNCDVRAHLICTVLEKKFHNLKTGKVWLFADSKRASKTDYYQDGGYPNLFVKSRGVNWGFHVAPLIILGTDTLIIDPSTENSAVSLRRWVVDLISLDSKGFLIIKNNIYFCFPSDEDGKFMDCNPTWDCDLDNSGDTDVYTDLAEMLSEAYCGFTDRARVMYYKSKIMELCGE